MEEKNNPKVKKKIFFEMENSIPKVISLEKCWC